MASPGQRVYPAKMPETDITVRKGGFKDDTVAGDSGQARLYVFTLVLPKEV